MSKDYDEFATTIGDFTLLVSAIPKGPGFTTVDLREALRGVFEGEGYRVEAINFVYDAAEYLDLKKRLDKRIGELHRLGFILESLEARADGIDLPGAGKGLGGLTRADFDKKKAKIEKEVNDAEMKIIGLGEDIEAWEEVYRQDKTDYMIGKAFVTFNSAISRNECFDRFSRSGLVYTLFGAGNETTEDLCINLNGNDLKMHVELPLQPKDVKWEHLDVTWWSKLLRQSVSWILGIFIINQAFDWIYAVTKFGVSQKFKKFKFLIFLNF